VARSEAQPITIPSPGARVVIRDTEWVIRRVDDSSDGGWQLTCDGVSPIVRGRTALFLTSLEGQIRVLDPAQTELVGDPSPRYAAGLLHIESLLRAQVPNDERLYIGHRGAMDLVPTSSNRPSRHCANTASAS
jgi:hypothetical protein